eukprot:15474627-Alexandrium_andersonii.AAC.1
MDKRATPGTKKRLRCVPGTLGGGSGGWAACRRRFWGVSRGWAVAPPGGPAGNRCKPLQTAA